MDGSTGDLARAFQEGFDSWEKGHLSEENPYAVGSYEAFEWLEGFGHARDEASYRDSLEDYEGAFADDFVDDGIEWDNE